MGEIRRVESVDAAADMHAPQGCIKLQRHFNPRARGSPMRLASGHALSILVPFVFSLPAADAPAQNYPTKPIHMLVSPVGGGNDFVARIIAPGISAPLGQQIV